MSIPQTRGAFSPSFGLHSAHQRLSPALRDTKVLHLAVQSDKAIQTCAPTLSHAGLISYCYCLPDTCLQTEVACLGGREEDDDSLPIAGPPASQLPTQRFASLLWVPVCQLIHLLFLAPAYHSPSPSNRQFPLEHDAAFVTCQFYAS